MKIEGLKDNIEHMKKILNELYVFKNHIQIINNLESKKNYAVNSEEKRLLEQAVTALTNQLKILNRSLPPLIEGIKFFKKLDAEQDNHNVKSKLVQIEYNPDEKGGKVSLVISEDDKKEFLENLSKSNISRSKLKKNFSVNEPEKDFSKPVYYAKISNHFFRDFSNQLIAKGSFNTLNRDLRKINSQFVVGTYTSMMFFSILIAFLISIIAFIFLLFFDVSINIPFFSIATESILERIPRFIGIVFLIPAIIGLVFYIYPSSQAKNLGKKIDQELPFVAIHMSAIATSGVEPMNIFKILLKTEEYKFSSIEFRKILNLVNFQGKDMVSALRETAKSCPSERFKILLEGLATSVTSGGNLHDYLDKHSESLLFDYRLEREKYTKISETFMDIYISIVIAAPLIFLMLFVILGSTGTLLNYVKISMDAVSVIIILGICLINVAFLVFLKIKQPTM